MKTIIKISCILLVLTTITFVFTTFANASFISLKTTNTVNILGPITGESVSITKRKLLNLDMLRGNKKYPIYLVVNSGGGSIHAGNSLIGVIKGVKNVQTITYFAGSMAAAIVQQTPGTRNIVSNGLMMFHKARKSFQGQLEDTQIETQLRLWRSIVKDMELANANRLKISLDEYKKRIKNEYWLTSDETLLHNATDKKVIVKCSTKLINSIVTQKIQTLFGKSVTKISACPAAR